MMRALAALVAAVPIALAVPGTAAATTGCAGLTGIGTVTGAREAETNGHRYCEVTGVMRPQTRYTLKLPVSGWTGQYVQQGCGGLCGAVPELVVPLFGFQCAPALDGRLALGATDSGHTGTDPADGRFGADPRLRVEFGLTSEHRLAGVATTVMRAYYGRPPAHRYFDGCSTGGRQGLNLAQRFPADFDGILAGAPAANLTGLDLYNAWLVRHNTGPGGRDIVTRDTLPILHAAVVAACGDPVPDPRRCHFDPASIQCPAVTPCLTRAQVDAVREIYRGPHDRAGRRLYSGGAPYGSELEWAGEFAGADDTERIALSFFRYLAYPAPRPGFDLDDVRFTRAALARLNVVGDAIYNATDPDLSAFARRGGKLILYHGWADSAIPPAATVDYYAALERHAGGFAGSQRFSRLYMIPGGHHCLITPTEMVFAEMLQPLMDWVEHGTAPGALAAPTLSVPDYQLIRYADVPPFDALRQ
jgi:hypothetical protein